MNTDLRSRLGTLQADFNQVCGHNFSHFYCPILFRDEETPLCKGHIINQAFPNSSRAWTVQRKDVDNWYGSSFESDFTDMRVFKTKSMAEIMVDKDLSSRFNSRIYRENKPVDFFFTKSAIPDHATELKFEGMKTSAPMALKMSPDEIQATEKDRWEIEIKRDITIPMLVSVIKSAHLTLFHKLGYQYVLSAAGRFLGCDILGKFYLQNHGIASKADVVRNATQHFREWVHMVRPIISADFDIQGTVVDGTIQACMGSSCMPWAIIVFIKTDDIVHGVMVPTFQGPDQVAAYFDFMKGNQAYVHVAVGRFEENTFKISKDPSRQNWPKSEVVFSKSN